ncbi:transcriptional regulator [Leuconostoc mesenteroides subsp. cremoris]|uniref:helix-turn-helix domain-containing protein n=1 Tax=Leuconostoc mesenteroides TaxID=1245 RepID=UPI000A025CF6|nr:helix-turn-helix transcriptional regulator [Leuconostoc mesenteroides]ORI39388.1 transcriptional regulator [Leuconostoc mesenteroides subsp. cremoris]
MSIFERTKETAQRQGLTVSMLEKRANLSENSLYTWKKSTPKADNLRKVADILHVSTDYLLGRTDEMNPAQSNNELSGFDEEIMMAFDGKPIPDEDKEKLLEFARFLRSQRGK